MKEMVIFKMYLVIKLGNFVLWIIAGYVWGDWRNWSKYYSTILFFGFSNLCNCLLTYHYTLWSFTPVIINATFVNIIMSCITFPAIILIFIYHYPYLGSRFTKFLYIIAWVIFFNFYEFLFYLLGLIYYEHGWNLLWSFFFDLAFFPLMLLHYRKPPLAWLVAAALGITIFLGFHIPIQSIK